MGAHEAPRPTQSKYPWKSTLRSIIQFGSGLAVAAPTLYTAVTNQSPEQATGAGLTALLVSAAVTRLMANPFINEWLTKVGLGAEPKTPAA
ncbi:hypothetical protein CQ020_03865 [Arthrobacter sp. MYb23]|uniref:hypothetical protein n=1 Tax=unclassified Arthrobacter TaxID=235627 RepID=UPI000CFB33A0|nr:MULTISPECIES: hypothetical protein [unclassified Arthrobacter]PRB44356.1 hypothetical protein CQ038_03720 [Arthrobacter sp. MYb51]PRB98608.1 hypothetical protein CQ020_03865 [Arthrobacter sp. MYb23]